MTPFALKRAGDVDLMFDGVCLVDMSSRKSQQTNWTEIRIYRVNDGRYVTEVLGKTEVPGQRDRIKVTVVDTAADVKESLKREADGRTQLPKGTMYLTDLAVAALQEAAIKDEAIAATLVERL